MPYFESPKEFLKQMDIVSEELSLAMHLMQSQLQEACMDEDWYEACSICELAHDLLPVERTLGKMDVASSYMQGVFTVYEGVVKWAINELADAVEVFGKAAQHLEGSEKAPYTTGLVFKVVGDLSVKLAAEFPESSKGRKQYLQKAMGSYQKSLHVIQENIRLSEKSIELQKKLMEAFGETGAKLREEVSTSVEKEHRDELKLKLQAFPIMGLALASSKRLSLATGTGMQGFGVIETLKIEGSLYGLHATDQKASDVRIRSHHWYIISQVEGDSMDLVNIQDGDYVVLERPTDGEYEPENGDIVLAGTSLGEILKEYHEEDGDIWLEPRSSNEDHDRKWIIRKGTTLDSRFWVAAKVVAVLKRLR